MSDMKAVKDEHNQLPIPTIWRPIFITIVDAFIKQDYLLDTLPFCPAIISEDSATQIKDYIENYGESLIHLAEETWNSSVCLWLGDKWDVLIDLWTEGEGHSDLVLKATVVENDDSYLVIIVMVYVP